MTASEFRRIALSFPETTESSHMSHPDFRVGGKIFATLGYPDKRWGMVKLSPDLQAKFYESQPEIFVPVNGAWGKGGATRVRLKLVRKADLQRAMRAAWERTAPERLAALSGTK
ncbi:MAG TPA: MmcQ/YjbR family DNA-binding protein [Candidatus Acidoferrales bacterium]|nr:MmcQ/YjbR family DNA-binding protein [Candidatus Acidoferrales bacterium]